MFAFQAFGDAAINKEISELRVHCVTLGCSWCGTMKNFEVGLNFQLTVINTMESQTHGMAEGGRELTAPLCPL